MYQLWARSIGEAVSILTQNRDRDFLTSQLTPTLRDRSRWPSRSFKIFKVSREKSGFTRLYPTFPNFFYLKGQEKSRKTRNRASQLGPNFGTGRVALPDPNPICQKVGMAILISTRPDFCRDIIPLEISRQ